MLATVFIMEYKGFEIYSDQAYYDMIAIRKIGSKKFNETTHVSTVEEAKNHIDELTVLTDYLDWYRNKYGGVEMISDFWINEFLNGG